MKRFAWVFGFLMLCVLAFAGQGFYIENYDVDMSVLSSGKVLVTETIDVIFTQSKHGIMRNIPYKYPVDKKVVGPEAKRPFGTGSYYKTMIGDVWVEGGPLKKKYKGNDIVLRIGSPNYTVNGPKKYVIHYSVIGAINHFDTPERFSEFYWNVIGHQWDVTIKNAHFKVTLPTAMTNTEEYEHFVLTGSYGKKEHNVKFTFTDNQVLEGNTLRPLSPREGVTVGVRLPVGLIHQPGFIETWVMILLNSPHYLLPFIIFIFAFTVWFIWGRDKRIISMTRFHPPANMTPAEVGVLIDDKVDNCDVFALIFHWATRNIISIKEIPKEHFFSSVDYRFKKLSELPALAPSYEQTLFKGFFEGPANNVRYLSELKYKFADRLKLCKSQLYSHIKMMNYYNPASIALKSCLYFAAVLCVIAGGVGFVHFSQLSYIVVGIICAAELAFFGRYMYKKTAEGQKHYAAIKGFEEFVNRAERPALERLLKEDPSFFDKTVPYAIALGIGDKWGKKFDDLSLEQPDWYEGGRRRRRGHFSSYLFMRSLNRNMSRMNSTLTVHPQPKKSSSGFGGGSFSGGGGGGGFSGGGFGGGGGSSW